MISNPLEKRIENLRDEITRVLGVLGLECRVRGGAIPGVNGADHYVATYYGKDRTDFAVVYLVDGGFIWNQVRENKNKVIGEVAGWLQLFNSDEGTFPKLEGLMNGNLINVVG